MTQTDRLPALLDLTDELLIVSTLLDMRAVPSMLELCAASAERCQQLVARLVHMEARD